MSKTLRIAVACFIGGVVGTAIMVLVLPQIWYLGVLAGLAGGFLVGYTSFEFKKVLAAIPEAMRQTIRACRAAGNGFVWLLEWIFLKMIPALIKELLPTWRSFRKWAQQAEYPLFTLPLLIFTPFWHWFTYYATKLPGFEWTGGSTIFGVFILTVDFAFVIVNLGWILIGLTWLGARFADKAFWGKPGDILVSYENTSKAYIKRQHAKGLKHLPLTYGNATRWFLLGILIASGGFFWFFCFKIWHFLIKIMLIDCGKLVAKFGWTLFKLIHSQERLICGVDSALGVLAAYFLFVNGAHSIGEMIAIILSGGLFGAVFGVVNFELVSKRLLARYITIKS